MEMNWIGTQVKFHGILCMVSRAIDNTHYRLIAMNGTTEQLQKDKSFKEYHEWGAVAVPVYCPSCGKITWHDDTNIPDGEKYEVTCECCNTLVMKKKITNKAGGDTEGEADRLISFDACTAPSTTEAGAWSPPIPSKIILIAVPSEFSEISKLYMLYCAFDLQI